MSVESEIERISGKVNESLAKVALKGVTVPDGAGVNELPGLIESISGSGGGSGGSSEVLDALIGRIITEISNDHITNIGMYAFAGCANLSTADFPAVTNIGIAAFGECTGLTTINFPVAASIYASAFAYCIGLTTINFPAAQSIDVVAFQSCTGLTALILRNTEQVCTLSNTNAFTSTPIKSGTGYIYVPAALVDSYKAATNWTTYADQIRAIEDYPDICGG